METAEITLGGKIWPVPPLAVKQNRIIDPLIISLLPIFSTWASDPNSLHKIGKEQYEALLNIAYVAVTRGKPDFTKEQFEELSITLPELVAAFNIIAQQTGIFQRGASGEARAN